MPPLFVAVTDDDARVSTKWGIGFHKPKDTTVVFVALVFFDRRNEAEVRTINLGTPAGAREIALQLWQAADEADRLMNEAAQEKEGE